MPIYRRFITDSFPFQPHNSQTATSHWLRKEPPKGKLQLLFVTSRWKAEPKPTPSLYSFSIHFSPGGFCRNPHPSLTHPYRPKSFAQYCTHPPSLSNLHPTPSGVGNNCGQPQPVVLAVPCRGIHLVIPSIPHFIGFNPGCQSSWLPLRPFRDFGLGEVRRGVTSEYRIPGHPPEGVSSG